VATHLRQMMAWALAVVVVWSTVFVQRANASSAVQRVFLVTGGGGRVALGSASITEVGLGVQWLRFRVEGDQIMVKVWSEESSEPSGWELVVEDSTVSAGVYQTGFSRSGGSSQRDVYLDDLTITDLGGGSSGTG